MGRSSSLCLLLLTGFPYLPLGPSLLLVNCALTPYADLVQRMRTCYEGTFDGEEYDKLQKFGGYPSTAPHCSFKGYGDFGDDRSLTCEERFKSTNCLTERANGKIKECRIAPQGSVPNLPGIILIAWLQRYYIRSLNSSEYPDGRQCLEKAEFGELVPNDCAIQQSPEVAKIWYTGSQSSIRITRSAPVWSIYLNVLLFIACILGVGYNGYRWLDSVPKVTLPSGGSMTQWAGDRWSSARQTVSSRSAPIASSVSQWWNRSLAAASRASAVPRSSQPEENSMTAGQDSVTGSSQAMTPQQHSVDASTTGSQARQAVSSRSAPIASSMSKWWNRSLASARSSQPEGTSMTAGQDSVTGSSLAMTPQQHSMPASSTGSQASLPVGQETPMNAQPLASQETAQQLAQPPSVEQQPSNARKWLKLSDRWTSASQAVASRSASIQSSMSQWWNRSLAATSRASAATRSSQPEGTSMTPQQHSMAAPSTGSQANLQEQPSKQTAEHLENPLASTSAPMNEQPLASQMAPQEVPQQLAQPSSVEQPNISRDGRVKPEQPQKQPQVQPQVALQPQAPPQPSANSNEFLSDGSSPLPSQPTAQENPAVGQPDYFSHQQQLAYSPRGPPPPGYSGPGPRGFPPRSPGFPPRPGGFPPGPHGFPPRSAGYPAPGPGGFPPRSAGFPPRPGGYPPRPGGYPPGGYPPGPRGFPPRSAGYAAPGPRGFPPRSAGFPPRPGGIPTSPGGYGRGMPVPRSASGGQSPGGFPPRSPGIPPGQRGYAPRPGGFPPRSAGYPPPGPRGFPPPSAGFPPGPGGFPPRPAGFPPGSRGSPGPRGYPPRSAGYAAPGPRGFPPRSAGFPLGPAGYQPGPRGYPPRSAGYPGPGPGGYPPRSSGYPTPGPGGFPPRSAGFDPRMAGPRSASGGQWPRPG